MRYRYEPGGSELTRYPRSTPAAILVALALAMILIVGCSKDDTPTPPPRQAVLELQGILCNPLAPAPGDTARLTVRAAGEGDPAVYEWQAEGGTLVESSGISIEWAAPTDPGVYMVTVRASTGSEVRRDTAYVMVRNCEVVNTGLKYSFFPNLIEGELFCVGTNSNLSDRTFLGYHAYQLNNLPPTQLDKLTTVNINGGYDFKFYADGVLTGSITDGAEYIRQQPMNVIYFPYLTALPKTLWSNNEVAGTTFRKNQNRYPSVDNSLTIAVWQRTVVGLTDDGKKDLTNIRFRFSTGPLQTLTTAKDSVFQLGAWNYKYWRNIRPQLSPDNTKIVYFVDSTATFEPCIIPLDGYEPNLGMRHAIMVDARHGIFYYAGIKVTENTVFQWDPMNPTRLAFIDDKKQFCIFDYATETVEVLGTGLDEFVYSADGKLAAIAEDGVYILEPGQTEAKRVFTKERATDAVAGVNWSPGSTDQKLGFRMVRKGSSTEESFAALVIYSLNDDRWYFASPEIKPVSATEPTVNYRWWRAVFNPLDGGMYVPVPVSTSGGKSLLYHSY
jgi:hypothetical protein